MFMEKKVLLCPFNLVPLLLLMFLLSMLNFNDKLFVIIQISEGHNFDLRVWWNVKSDLIALRKVVNEQKSQENLKVTCLQRQNIK